MRTDGRRIGGRRTKLYGSRLPGNRTNSFSPAWGGLDDPPSLEELREVTERRLPRVDLPELLLEVNTWTGFADAFPHVSESRSRIPDLATSVCAALVAEACNIGLAPLVRKDNPALTRSRLSWIQQNYLRTAETLTQANAALVDCQATIPLAQEWGGGEVASADGLHFVVPVRTLNAGPNPRYFGAGRHLLQLHQRPVHRVPRHRCSRNDSRLPLRSRWSARARDESRSQ